MPILNYTTSIAEASSGQQRVVMRNPDPQIKAWVNSNKDQWDFWQEVLRRETWAGLGKSKEQVENLAGYFEGCYDMSLKIRDLLSQKKVDA